MPESSSILNDMNKVFIPCRTVLEMEALTSLYLATFNYDQIKELPYTRPSSLKLTEIFRVRDNPPYASIIDFFINVAVRKVKPIAMYAREHHDRYRMGNVIPYTKTRVYIFLALHRLKLKFLIIKNFLNKFRDNLFQLEDLNNENDLENNTLLSALYKEYYNKNKMNLKLMLPKKKVSERVSKLLNNKDSITTDKIMHMAATKFYSEDKDKIKFIMREIKASLFVCKLIFAQMDVINPFTRAQETMINVEEIMISNDFIPELIPAMSKCLSENNLTQFNECFNAFEFLIERVLAGINNAIEIASSGLLKIGLDETLYNTGNIFTI